MESYYDTSCLAKLYIPERDSERMIQHVKAAGRALLFTALHETELRNAIGLKAFRGEVERDEMTAAFLKIESDIQAGRLFQVSIEWSDVFRRANELSAAYTVQGGCRTLDILHVALASSFDCRHFITNDERQRNLARHIGMKVKW